MVNAGTFRTALKAMGKNSKNTSLKIYDFSAMQKVRMHMNYERLRESKGTKAAALSQLVRKIQRQADKKAKG